MVIVDPDKVIGLKQCHQLLREQLVHPPISGGKVDVEISQIEPVVKHGPQHIVGVPGIVRVVIALTQVHRGERHVADRLHAKILISRGGLRSITDFAAPAKP
jgi:hypothetical protein